MRFYPLMALFALFLAVFGVFFLFDASYRGGQEAGATAMYVTLDYAGALDRGAQSIFSIIVFIAAGLLLLFSVGIGAGAAAPRREAERVPATPRPTRAAEAATPRAVVARPTTRAPANPARVAAAPRRTAKSA
jgi:hypothetical protein